MHCHWRDCKAWQDEALPVSTTSDDAAKMFDATLTQYVGWYDDTSCGGIEGAVKSMIEADPNFALGHVLSVGLEVMGTGRNPDLDPSFKSDIERMSVVAETGTMTSREQQHVKAMKLSADGFMYEATGVWEDILVEHPTDMLATKFAHDAYFYLGLQPQMRDSIARVMAHWRPIIPLYGYLMGMHSFGLCETNMFAQAEKTARKGLELNARDAWSTHSLAHVLEMTGRYEDGVVFMSSTLNDWESCGMLACHNFWHWALYHLEKGETQAAVDIYDGEVATRASKSGAMLDIVDAASMLTRLELDGHEVGGRWAELYDVCRPHHDDHLLAFNDVHLLMTYLGASQISTVTQFTDSLATFIRDGHGTNQGVSRDVGRGLCEAWVAYDNQEYDKAVRLLHPLRYRLINIGGSNAQRDVFNLFLIDAAIKSSCAEHQKLARHLLAERQALRENSPLTERLLRRAMTHHAD